MASCCDKTLTLTRSSHKVIKRVCYSANDLTRPHLSMFKWRCSLLPLLISLSNACPTGWQQSLVEVNKCYLVSKAKVSWPDAERHCQNYGGTNSHLSSILSAFEANEISGKRGE